MQATSVTHNSYTGRLIGARKNSRKIRLIPATVVNPARYVGIAASKLPQYAWSLRGSSLVACSAQPRPSIFERVTTELSEFWASFKHVAPFLLYSLVLVHYCAWLAFGRPTPWPIPW
jgi:hypothetical protein